MQFFCFYSGFLGTSKATVPANEAHSHPLEFELGQSVRVVVRDVGGDDGDENGGGDVNGDGDSTGSPTVDLFDAATKTNGLLLLREYPIFYFCSFTKYIIFESHQILLWNGQRMV